MPSATPFSQPITLGLWPAEGPREIYWVFDLTTRPVVRQQFDISQLGVTMIQSALVDNSQNMQAVTLQIDASQQIISVGPQRQLFVPILATRSAFALTVASTGAVPVAIHFFNVPVPPIDYSGVPPTVLVSGGAVSIAGTAAVSVVNTPAVSQSGAWTVAATQSGAWTAAATQSGAWTVRTTGATASALNASGLVVSGTGRLWSVAIHVAGAAGTITDGAGTIMATPAAVTTMTFDGGFPFTSGLTVNPGVGQSVSVAYST